MSATSTSRATIARALGADPETVVFTSGSTESSNLALKGVALALGEKKGRHVVTTRIEDFPEENGLREHVVHCMQIYELLGANPNRIRPRTRS